MRTCLLAPALCVVAFSQSQPKPEEPVYKFYSTVFGTTVLKAGGLTGLVYTLEPGTPHLPSFDRMRPISKVYTTTLNIQPQDFTLGFPGVPERFEWFAIDYTGNIWISQAGKYRFTLESDDGSALFIDGRLVINNDGIHPVILKKGSNHLKAGKHSIRVAYFQGPRQHLALILQIAGPGESLQVFDTNRFAPPGAGQ